LLQQLNTSTDATNLDLVAHRTLASDHYLAARVHFELLRCHAARSENPSNKVELDTSQTQLISQMTGTTQHPFSITTLNVFGAVVFGALESVCACYSAIEIIIIIIFSSFFVFFFF